MSHEQDAMFAENSFLINYSTSLLINIVSKKKIKKTNMCNITILDVTFNIKIQNIKLLLLNIIQFYQLCQDICFEKKNQWIRYG